MLIKKNGNFLRGYFNLENDKIPACNNQETKKVDHYNCNRTKNRRQVKSVWIRKRKEENEISGQEEKEKKA